MRVRFAGGTDVGRKRDHNEDSIYLPTEARLGIVADGMGGHASGEVASKLAVDTMVAYFHKTSDMQPLTWPFKVDRDIRAEVNRMVTAIMLANVEIFETAGRDPACKGMGTTVDAINFLDDTVIIGHVGDSRVYRHRDSELIQITEDHSLINDYIKMKRVTVEEAENWPHKNVIVRALGMKDTVQVDISRLEPQPNDVYILCSDGLSGMVPEAELTATLQSLQSDDASRDNVEALCHALINAANKNGGTDNVTVVAIKVIA
jgi:protein phosphatase